MAKECTDNEKDFTKMNLLNVIEMIKWCVCVCVCEKSHLTWDAKKRVHINVR